MYYFCNFIDKELKGHNKKGVADVSISDLLDSDIQVAKCNKIVENGVVSLKFSGVEEEVDGEEIDFLGKFSSSAVNCSNEDLVSTYENPIILVATKSIEVFDGVPSYIKYFPVKGGVLVGLVKGCISVEDKDGNMISLARNFSDCTVGLSYKITADDMKDLNLLEDSEAKLKYSDLVVSDCLIKYFSDKVSNSVVKSVKFNKNNFVVLNESMFEEAKKKVFAEKLALHNKKVLQKEREVKILAELQKQREDSKAKKKEKPKKEKKENNTVLSGSEGAQSFLNCLAGMNIG